jgi:hypothetical protein
MWDLQTLPSPRSGPLGPHQEGQFCDLAVSVYTGYLDVDQGAKHLFLFESRIEPGKDDVLWLTSASIPQELDLL